MAENYEVIEFDGYTGYVYMIGPKHWRGELTRNDDGTTTWADSASESGARAWCENTVEFYSE